MNEQVRTFKEFLPKKKIGFLAPLPVIDNVAYQFYRLAPNGMMGAWLPIGLEEFTLRDVERVFTPLEKYLSILVERKVDMIAQVGVPLPILMGLEYHDDLLIRIEKTSGLPATSTVMNVVTSAKSLGIRNIALANKWNVTMNSVLGSFFMREGIRIAGINTRSMSTNEIVRLQGEENISLAYELGRKALKDYPEADGLYIGGGAWLTYPVVEPLEKEFGKPVINNENATVWHIGHLLNYWRPRSGYGRLMEAD